MSSVYRPQFFPTVLGAFAAANCAIFLYFVDKTLIHGPIMDTLDWIQFYTDQSRAGDIFSYFWQPHNEHRVVLARILVALDLKWFDRIGPSFVLSGLLLVIAMAVTICREIVNSPLPTSWKRAAVSISVLLVTPANIVVLVTGPNICGELQTCTFAVFSLVLLDGSGKRGRLANFRRLAAVLAACVTAFGVSAGLLIWPPMIWSAWRSRLPWAWVAGIAGAGVLFIAAYTWHLPAHIVPDVFTLPGIISSFDYMIRFLGLPWARLPVLVWPGRLIGFAFLCLGLFAVLRDGLSGRPNTRLQRVGLGLVLFSLLVAASAPLARLNLAEGVEVPIRYAAFVVPLHCGLLLWSLELVHDYWRPKQPALVKWGIVIACGFWLAQQIVIGDDAIAVVNRINAAWSRFVAGEWTPDMVSYIYPKRDIAEARLATLREIHFNLGN
jgi:hypothetical protein